MKKLIAIFLLVALNISMVFAVGESNLDTDGGSLGTGTSTNSWSSGYDGVRVTVINANTNAIVSTPIDYTNINASSVKWHFGKVSKHHYTNTVTVLTPTSSDYTYRNPVTTLPTIITSSSGTGVSEEIKSYFTDQEIVEMIASDIGADYDILINGDYKLLLEPIAYFTYDGVYYAMTATEAGLYDSLLSGDLASKMGSLTHQNLPLALFLNTADLGYSAWTGTSASRVTNSQIYYYLGVGIVSFEDEPDVEENDDFYDYEYHTDTDVIASVYVYASSEIDPDDDAYVSFKINGTTYKKYFVCPAGSSQIVWVKFTTPSTPQEMTITVSTTDGSLSASRLYCNITEIEENTPPDPTPYDTNSSFLLPNTTIGFNNNSVSWSEWWAYWQENWVDNGSWDYDYWTDSDGVEHRDRDWNSKWEDEGWWVFDTNDYTAYLISDTTLVPSESVPTEINKTFYWEMKSGYGVEIEVYTKLTHNTNSYDITDVQNVFTYFPEFSYKTYDRWLEPDGDIFVFKDNEYSFTGENNHYTPLWYPDNTKYEVISYAFDCWTPVGELWYYSSDYVMINGNVYDDYDIVEVSPRDESFWD